LRGYSPKGANHHTLMLSLHAAPLVSSTTPTRWRAIISSIRLPANEVLAQAKTANKLAQIMARMEAEAAGVEEALLINSDGCVTEASSSNLFWIRDGVVETPPLASGALPGVTRSFILEICAGHAIAARESNILPGELLQADGAFLSLSSLGVVELTELDGKRLKVSPLVDKIRAECLKAMAGK